MVTAQVNDYVTKGDIVMTGGRTICTFSQTNKPGPLSLAVEPSVSAFAGCTNHTLFSVSTLFSSISEMVDRPSAHVIVELPAVAKVSTPVMFAIPVSCVLMPQPSRAHHQPH